MAARLAPTDTQRIVRALEVFEQTGRSLAEWQKVQGTPVIEENETVRLLVARTARRFTPARMGVSIGWWRPAHWTKPARSMCSD